MLISLTRCASNCPDLLLRLVHLQEWSDWDVIFVQKKSRFVRYIIQSRSTSARAHLTGELSRHHYEVIGLRGRFRGRVFQLGTWRRCGVHLREGPQSFSVRLSRKYFIYTLLFKSFVHFWKKPMEACFWHGSQEVAHSTGRIIRPFSKAAWCIKTI